MDNCDEHCTVVKEVMRPLGLTVRQYNRMHRIRLVLNPIFPMAFSFALGGTFLGAGPRPQVREKVNAWERGWYSMLHWHFDLRVPIDDYA